MSLVEITDEEGIALAKGGPHWNCSSCGTVNLDTHTTCPSCGNPREASDGQNRIIELGTSPPTSHDLTAQTGSGSSEISQRAHLRHPHVRIDTVKESDTRIPWGALSIGIGVVVLLAMLGWALFHTTSVKAQVSGFSWSRDISIERYQTVHDSGWSHPVSAYNITSDYRIRSYEPIYQPKIRSVRHSRTCFRDRGNGSVESYDCSYNTIQTYQEKIGDRPIYDTWYEYDVDRWVFNRTAHAEGSDQKAHWPEYTLHMEGQTALGAERVSGESESYTVYFHYSDGDKSTEYVLKTTYDEWVRYRIEDSYPLEVNSFNAIMNNPLQDKEGNEPR